MPRVASDLFGMYHARLIDRCHKWQVVKRHAWEPHPRVAQEFEMPCHVWHQLFSVCTTRGKRCYRHVPRVTHGRRVRREATRGTKARRGAARAVRSHAWHLWCWWWWCAHSLRITSGRLPRIWGSIPLCWSPTRTLHTYILYTTPTQTTTESARCYAGGRKRGVAHIDTCHRLFHGQDTNFHSGDPIEVG